jgi:adenine nucleotide transporter 17
MSLKSASLTPLEAFVCGALAKALATVLTYPLQLAQTLLRLQRKTVSSQSPNNNSAEPGSDIYHEGTFDCLYKQFSSAGMRGLFHGMNAKMLQTVLTAAFTFLTYEQTLTRVGRIYDALGSSR